MTELLWLGGVLGALVVMAIGLKVIGADRWAALIRTQRGQLESGRVNDRSPAQGRLPSSARSSARSSGRPPARPPARFDAHELKGLPASVHRYFRAVLKDGQPIIAAATIEMAGKINMSATAERWKPFTSQQRVVTAASGSQPGFLWDARASTLIISARDDRYGTYASAQYTASQIAGAKFVGFDEGGHTWVGHNDEVMAEIVMLLAPSVGR